MLKSLYIGVLSFGAATNVATAVIAPQYLAVSAASIGGLLSGLSLAIESQRKRNAKEVEAVRVAETFKHLYDKNRGLLNPQELSLLTEVSLERTDLFLRALAADQSGQPINTDKGIVYNFPHPENILDQLTNNAQAWVASQTEPLLKENNALKQQLALLQAISMNRNKQPMPQVPQVLKNDEEAQDPWNNLL